MDKSIRFYDAGAEGFYHGLVLGLIALMDNQYKIKSNRESGDGRYIVHQQLLALAKEGRTMVIVTHRHEGVNDYITAPVNIPELIRRVLFFVE